MVTPITEVSSSFGSAHLNFETYSLTDAMAGDSDSPNKVHNAQDFKNFPPRPFKRYYNCSKFYKSINYTWMATGLYYPQASTGIRMYGVGYAQDNPMFKVTAVWYVRLKGQQD